MKPLVSGGDLLHPEPRIEQQGPALAISSAGRRGHTADSRSGKVMATPHQDAIEALSRAYGRSAAEVAQLYDEELRRLESIARIPHYLALLASRRVRARLLAIPST